MYNRDQVNNKSLEHNGKSNSTYCTDNTNVDMHVVHNLLESAEFWFVQNKRDFFASPILTSTLIGKISLSTFHPRSEGTLFRRVARCWRIALAPTQRVGKQEMLGAVIPSQRYRVYPLFASETPPLNFLRLLLVSFPEWDKGLHYDDVITQQRILCTLITSVNEYSWRTVISLDLTGHIWQVVKCLEIVFDLFWSPHYYFKLKKSLWLRI